VSLRFAAVEPFYNGQARVERMDGRLEVIDETGKFLIELRAVAGISRIALFQSTFKLITPATGPEASRLLLTGAT